MKPLADLSNPNNLHPDLIWYSLLDGKWQCEVQRRDDRDAMLIIFDHVSNDTPIYQEAVSLAYGAVFGPDVDDVQFWQQRCIEVVDNLGKGED